MPNDRDAIIRKVTTHRVGGGISDWLLVTLTTEAGVIGVGDATLEGQTDAVEAIVGSLCERLLGWSAFGIADFVATVLDTTFWRGGPVLMSAIGGVEIAMWDVVGKLLDQPIHRLLGGSCRSSIRAYANGWYRSIDRPQQFAEEAQAVVADGYTALKLDPLGKTWREFTPAGFRNAVEIVAAIREAVGDDVDILLDLHGRLSPPAAAAFVKALDPLAPYWVEEPVPPEQLHRIEEVFRDSSIRAALGERFYTRSACAEFLKAHRVDVIQSDLGHAGGLLEGMRTASVVDAFGASIAPHTGNSPVITAASLHLAGCAPNGLIQEMFEDYDHPTMRSKLFDGLPALHDGEIPIPKRPGLGIDFDERAWRDYPPQPHRKGAVLVDDEWPRLCWAE